MYKVSDAEGGNSVTIYSYFLGMCVCVGGGGVADVFFQMTFGFNSSRLLACGKYLAVRTVIKHMEHISSLFYFNY